MPQGRHTSRRAGLAGVGCRYRFQVGDGRMDGWMTIAGVLERATGWEGRSSFIGLALSVALSAYSWPHTG